MAPQITLTYFDFPGRAEPIRMALAMTGDEWEDKRLSFEEFAALKPSLPLGQVPILEVDGKSLNQSMAILRFVGKRAGIYPADPLLAAYADVAVDSVADSFTKFLPSIIEEDSEKKMAMRKDLSENFLPMWLDNLEKTLQAAGGEYLVGGQLSIADLAVVCRLESLKSGVIDGIPTTIVDGYPLLSALIGRVHAEPKIAAYEKAKVAKKK